ncbi:phospholipase D family protein [Syntrophomonas curvata]
MNFYIQDPTYPESYSLHEALLSACEGAIYGGGTYAFVTPGGVKLFLEDQVFIDFVSNGSFKLVVGIDEITSDRALETLGRLSEEYSNNLEISAFSHNTKGSLFHPKFSWFKTDSGGTLVLGSGNLTEKGLRRNREAFTVIDVDEAKINEIEERWNDWLAHNGNCLKSVDDIDVLNKVKENAMLSSRIYRKSHLETDVDVQDEEEIQVEPIIENEDFEAWSFADRDSVLITEIPKSGNRWNQVNFDKNSFINFFGAQPGDNSLRILLRNVLSDGTLDEIEVRPSVSVVCHNWRFELKAAANKLYPINDRPIGIFIRVSPRMFLYVLAMPTDVFYYEVRQFLDQKYNGRADRMKRYQATVQEVKTFCGNLPFWNIID